MKQLSCKDLGSECGFVATGATEEEVMGKMMEHAKKDHADMMAGMSAKDMEDMKMKMKEKMMDV